MSHTMPSNPFASLIDPKAVADAMRHAERLQRLVGKIHRPLDRGAARRALAGDRREARPMR